MDFWNNKDKEYRLKIQDKMRNACIKSYNKFYEVDTRLKEIDKEYRTTLINFAKYHLIMFAMAKIMEVTKEEQNQVALYLYNCIKFYE